MAINRWQDLDQRTRRSIVAAGALDGALRIAALLDLVRRPAHEVRGSKARWTLGLLFINSGGVVPIAYFWRVRRSR